jgi:hypothetical protein
MIALRILIVYFVVYAILVGSVFVGLMRAFPFRRSWDLHWIHLYLMPIIAVIGLMVVEASIDRVRYWSLALFLVMAIIVGMGCVWLGFVIEASI